MKLEDEKLYSLKELIEGNIITSIAPALNSYMQFIGRQALQGNKLQAQPTKSYKSRDKYKFLGKDVKSFISNIK